VVSKIFNNLGTWAEYPCAGCFGDINDVLTFAEALAGRGPADYQLLSPEMFEIARQNTTGDLPLETIMVKGLPTLRQMIKTLGLPRLVKTARAARRASTRVTFDPTPYPAHFTLLGGYTRGTGNIFTPAGRAASPSSLVAVGGGSTGWMIDPERDLTVVFMSAGLVEGFEHPRRLQQINDLVIASAID
jgi:CubicO group peptidase (beta-lactamase class C family)